MIDSFSPWQITANEFACNHEHTQFTRFIKSNGAVCVRIQCLNCGTSVKEVSKQGHDIECLPLFNEAIRHLWSERQQDRRRELQEQRQQEVEQARQEQNEQWWYQYNQYLRSQQWYDIRQRVLERDSHLCQACLRNKATQVHHLSYELYEKIGRSAAFELVAICHRCHQTIHPHMADTQRSVVEQLHNPYLNGEHDGRKQLA